MSNRARGIVRAPNSRAWWLAPDSRHPSDEERLTVFPNILFVGEFILVASIEAVIKYDMPQAFVTYPRPQVFLWNLGDVSAEGQPSNRLGPN